MTAADRPPAFPWDQVIAFGLTGLRLSPTDLWTLTLPELALLVRAAAPATDPLSRRDFSSLMTRFPDKDLKFNG